MEYVILVASISSDCRDGSLHMLVFEKIFAAIPDGLIVVGSDGRILHANQAAGSMFGYRTDELVGLGVDMLVPPRAKRIHAELRAAYAAAPSARKMGTSSNLRGQRKDGRLFPVDIMLSPLALEQQEATLCVIRDATAQKQLETRLDIANTVFETTQEAIVVTDVNCHIVAINPAFEKVTEYSKADVIGQHMRILSSGRHDECFYRQMWAQLLSTGEWQGAIWNRRKGGEIYQEWLSISTVRDHAGQPFQYVGISADLGRMKHVETPIERLAHYDNLTGLPNRLLFNSRLQKTMEHAHREGRAFAVMFLDLDGFKAVNDSHGHAVGDELLKQVALRLRADLRETDTIARFGGDEFVIVLEDARRQDVEMIAQELVDKIGIPFDLGLPASIQISLSLGWSAFPEHADNIASLLRQADQALYQVKRTGRGAWKAFGT